MCDQDRDYVFQHYQRILNNVSTNSITILGNVMLLQLAGLGGLFGIVSSRPEHSVMWLRFLAGGEFVFGLMFFVVWFRDSQLGREYQKKVEDEFNIVRSNSLWSGVGVVTSVIMWVLCLIFWAVVFFYGSAITPEDIGGNEKAISGAHSMAVFNSPELGSVIIGGLLAGSFSLFVLLSTIWWDRKKKTDDEQAQARRLCMVLSEELATIWESHDRAVGTMLNEVDISKGKIFGMYKIEQDYLASYNNNTDKLGLITNDKVRKKTAALYVKIKGTIDSFSMYNELLRMTMAAEGNLKAELGQEVGRYGAGLRDRHKELEVELRATIDMLRAYAEGRSPSCA